MISCPYCGKLTDPRLEGCVHCGGTLRKQAAPGQAQPQRSSETCPSCGALVQDGDIICVACGTNLLTGQRISEEKAAAKSRSIPLPPVRWIAAAVVAALVIAALFLVALMIFSGDPVQKAMRLKKDGKVTEASEILTKHLERHPDAADAHVALGTIQWDSRDYSEAAKSFDSAARSTFPPENRDAYLMAVASLNRQGKGSEQLPEIGAVLERMVQDFDGDPQARYLLALLRGAQGETAKQIETLKKLVDLAPENTEAQRFLGVAHALNGEAREASVALSGVLADRPGDADTLASMGLLAARQGDLSEATERLNAALEAQTSIETDVLVQLGLLLVSEGRYDEARGYLTQAVAQAPSNQTAQFYYGVCLQMNDSFLQEALAQFEPLTKAGGEYAAEAAVRAAQAYLQLGDLDNASLNTHRAIKLGGDGPELYTVHGRVLAALDELQEARSAFAKAMQADDNYAPAHLEAGLLAVQRNSAREGIRELDKYLRLADPEEEGERLEQVKVFLEQLRDSATGPRTRRREPVT